MINTQFIVFPTTCETDYNSHQEYKDHKCLLTPHLINPPRVSLGSGAILFIRAVVAVLSSVANARQRYAERAVCTREVARPTLHVWLVVLHKRQPG